MTILTALTALIGAASAAPVAVTPIGSAPVLLTKADQADVRRRGTEFRPQLKKCDSERDYAPIPTAVFGPDPHYSATGLNPSRNNAKQFAADSRAAYRAALCYVVSGDPKYAANSRRILDAWSTTMTKVTTEQGKADINFNAPYLIMAASWIRGVDGWDGVRFGEFLRSTILPNSTSGKPNNHGMWGTLTEASAAAYLGDAALLTKARDRWTEIFKGAASQDGTLMTEVERSDTTNWSGGPTKGIRGLAYTHYFLLPAAMSAKIFADEGQPVWQGEGGTLLRAAFGKAAGWTLHPETFPFYASNGGKLQDTRGIAYFPLLLRYYPNRDAEAALRQGSVSEGGFLLPILFPYESGYAAKTSRR